MGLLASSGHSTIFTTALSPVVPPLSFSLGMKMSVARNLLSVLSRAKYFFTSRVPVNTCSLRSSILMTSASGSMPSRAALMCTSTLSPLSACIELRSATKMGLPSSLAVSTLFLPLLRRMKMPSSTVLRCRALNLPGVLSLKKPSISSCSRISTTRARCLGVLAPTLLDTCL